MQISIRHRTVYSYGEEATYSIQRLRLTPAPCDNQKILNWQISAPGIKTAASYVDGFGNQVHLISVTGRHREVAIEVEGEIETSENSGMVSGLLEIAPLALYHRETPLTKPDRAITAMAAKARGDDEVARLHDLMKLILDRVEYQPGETNSETTAAEAVERGSGVCQDHTHIFLAAARVLGFPARYISGYLWATEDEPKEGANQEAQHAWAEVNVANLGWVGFDVSNGISPDPHYVRVACGLDYTYAAPVKGLRRGGGDESLDVHVAVGAATQSQQ